MVGELVAQLGQHIGEWTKLHSFSTSRMRHGAAEIDDCS